MRSVGSRLELLSREVAAKVHGKRQTVIHGDAKIANFFFRDSFSGGGGDCGRPEVGLIDFQWSGPGLAAVDVAYCIWASASLEVLAEDGGEARLVAAYHSSLAEALEAAGVTREVDCSNLRRFHTEVVIRKSSSILL